MYTRLTLTGIDSDVFGSSAMDSSLWGGYGNETVLTYAGATGFDPPDLGQILSDLSCWMEQNIVSPTVKLTIELSNDVWLAASSSCGWVWEEVIGNDNISGVVSSFELYEDYFDDVPKGRISKTLADYAGPVGTALDALEAVKLYCEYDADDPESRRDIAKFIVELGVGMWMPILSIPVTILMNDARSADGLTNLDNGQLAGAYEQSFNSRVTLHQRRAQEAEAARQREVEVRNKERAKNRAELAKMLLKMEIDQELKDR